MGMWPREGSLTSHLLGMGIVTASQLRTGFIISVWIWPVCKRDKILPIKIYGTWIIWYLSFPMEEWECHPLYIISMYSTYKEVLEIEIDTSFETEFPLSLHKCEEVNTNQYIVSDQSLVYIFCKWTKYFFGLWTMWSLQLFSSAVVWRQP